MFCGLWESLYDRVPRKVVCIGASWERERYRDASEKVSKTGEDDNDMREREQECG